LIEQKITAEHRQSK